MTWNYITFRSVTFAQKGESALRQKMIETSLQRTPRWMEEQGCGYCLRLPPVRAEEAVQLLKSRQIPFRKVYTQTAEGFTEVKL